VKSAFKIIFGIIGGVFLFVLVIIALVIVKHPYILVVPNGPGYTRGEELQIFGCLLGAPVLVLSYRAIPIMLVPTEKRTKGNLWFVIAWLASLGIAALCLLLPPLFPWQPWHDSIASLLVPGIIFFLSWCLLVRAFWKSVLELNRRNAATTS
jgi:hypothetical protein